MWTINGILCKTEKEVRDYCTNYMKRKFQQDIRLVNGARTLPLPDLLDLLSRCGHDVVYE